MFSFEQTLDSFGGTMDSFGGTLDFFGRQKKLLAAKENVLGQEGFFSSVTRLLQSRFVVEYLWQK